MAGRFGSWGTGCGCCSSGCNQPFSVTLCGQPMAGAVVTVTQSGAAIGTATTNATGQCSVPVPATGTFQYSCAGSNVPTKTGSFFISCGSTVSTVAVNMNPATTNCCAGTYLPSTLYVTDAQGTHSLVLQPASSQWQASYIATLYPVQAVAGGSADCTQPPVTGSVQISYSLSCSGGQLQLIQSWDTFECFVFGYPRGNPPYFPTSLAPGTQGGQSQGVQNTQPPSSPINLTFTFPSTTPDAADQVTPIPVPFTSATVTQ